VAFVVLNVLVLIFAIDWLSKRMRLWAIGEQGERMTETLSEAPTLHPEAEVGADVIAGPLDRGGAASRR
jgi:uncharacterized membrane protein